MATNASKYYATYMQSHTERFQRFRDEAYAELMQRQKDDLAYRKLLQKREKDLIDAAAKIRAVKPSGNKGFDKDLYSLILRANQQYIDASEDSAKRQIQIERDLRGALVPTKASNDSIAEMDSALSTGGAATADPAVVAQLVSGGIDKISSTIAPGSMPAAAAAQNTWKSLSANPQFLSLPSEEKASIKAKIATTFGLDSVDIGGMSGQSLIDAPQNVLVQAEVDKQLLEYGTAYGTGRSLQVLRQLDAAMKAASEGKIDEANQGLIDAKNKLAEGIEGQLPSVQEELAKAPKGEFTETDVRALARQKYGPEAATMLKKQFERDAIGGDPDKLLHYDAIQAVREGKVKPDSDATTAAKQLLSLQPAMTKAEERARAIKAAVEYAAGNTSKRDQFLIAYHAEKMGEQVAKSAPSDIIPEPIDVRSKIPGYIETYEGGGAVFADTKKPASPEGLPDYMRKGVTEGFKTDDEGYLVGREGKTPVLVPKAFREGSSQPYLFSKEQVKGALPEKVRTKIGNLPGMADLFKLDY